MKICFNIGSLSYSGAEKIMFHMIESFFKLGNDVSVILAACELPEKKLDKEIKQYPIYATYREQKNKVKRTLNNHRAINQIIKRENFDCVISFGAIYNIDIAEACFFNKTKLVLCERNDPIHDPKSKLLRLRRRIAYLRGDAFVFQTETIKAFFPKMIQKKSFVIPNFIEKQPEEKYDKQRLCFATSARLDDNQKDQITMIDAFSIFVKSHPQYTLEFYGDGPDREKLKREVEKLNIQNNVVFWGRVTNPMQSIRTATAFVLSSKYEGMPNSLIEAMSYGMPCISSRCSGGGAEYLIENEENGLLFNIGDVEALADAMARIADDEEFACKLGNEARRINERLDIQRIIKVWQSVAERMIQ